MNTVGSQFPEIGERCGRRWPRTSDSTTRGRDPERLPTTRLIGTPRNTQADDAQHPGSGRAGRGRRAEGGLIGNIRVTLEMDDPDGGPVPEEGVEGMGEIIYQVTRFHRGFQGPGQASLDRTLDILEDKLKKIDGPYVFRDKPKKSFELERGARGS